MEHCVTEQLEPFLIADGRLQVHQVRVWQDNYSWVLVCVETGQAAVVDGPEAQPVLDYCSERGIDLSCILNTHTHADHIGINRALAADGQLDNYSVIGSKSRASEIPGLTVGVGEGDTVRVGKVEAEVWLTEGHIDGHISFVFDGAVFCGDTLFAAGCGYLFDGPPAKMHRSLARLASLPPSTLVCCAHEYTVDNLRFARWLEPDNNEVAERIDRVSKQRNAGRSTVPSSLAEELSSNPFLAWDRPSVHGRIKTLDSEVDVENPVEVFAAIRRLKDSKAYRTDD